MQAAEVLNSPTPTSTVLSEIIFEKQLARDLEIDIRTLRRWHQQRTGPPRAKLGRKIVYLRSAVLKWLEKNQSSAR